MVSGTTTYTFNVKIISPIQEAPDAMHCTRSTLLCKERLARVNKFAASEELKVLWEVAKRLKN